MFSFNSNILITQYADPAFALRDQAERAFEAVRNLDPYRLWDMEVYSTLLWHLQRSVKLAFLARELLAINPRSPEAWIAVGNTFSLQKERSQALTCFDRAAQLDPMCAYAFTLSGHETIDEDLQKATRLFECALRADRRHYNAWCVIFRTSCDNTVMTQSSRKN